MSQDTITYVFSLVSWLSSRSFWIKCTGRPGLESGWSYLLLHPSPLLCVKCQVFLLHLETLRPAPLDSSGALWIISVLRWINVSTKQCSYHEAITYLCPSSPRTQYRMKQQLYDSCAVVFWAKLALLSSGNSPRKMEEERVLAQREKLQVQTHASPSLQLHCGFSALKQGCQTLVGFFFLAIMENYKSYLLAF